MNAYNLKPGNARIYFFMLLFLLTASLISLSFLVNIIIHESGHYIVADAFGLNPTMHFFDPLYGEDGRLSFNLGRLNSEPVAYTQFSQPGSLWESVNITIAGVMANLLFAMIICFIYTFTMKNAFSEMVFLSVLAPTILSVVINLNIFSHISDGAVLFRLILGGA